MHALGLAFDLDPYITGYSEDGDPLYSVYTGFWTPGFVEQHAEELYDLGVIKRADIFSFWDLFLNDQTVYLQKLVLRSLRYPRVSLFHIYGGYRSRSFSSINH